jgi:hypothetical protein
MDTALALYPTSEQIAALLAGPQDEPVVMLNLLRFRAAAAAPAEGRTGEDTYRRYAEQMVPFVTARGGRVLWSGRLDAQVIGTGGERFHMAALVEYPSRRAFAEIAADPFVQEIGVWRAAGLEGQWLLAARTEAP